MSESGVQYAVMFRVPNGAYVVELLEAPRWSVDPSREPTTQSIKRFEIDRDYNGPWVMPELTSRDRWSRASELRPSAWRLLVLAEQARALHCEWVARWLCGEALGLPIQQWALPGAALRRPYISSARAAAIRTRRCVVLFARKRCFTETLLFCAADRIVRAELLLVRMRDIADTCRYGLGAHHEFAVFLYDQTDRLGRAFTPSDLAKARATVQYGFDTLLPRMLTTRWLRVVQPSCAEFLGLADRYVAQAWG